MWVDANVAYDLAAGSGRTPNPLQRLMMQLVFLGRRRAEHAQTLLLLSRAAEPKTLKKLFAAYTADAFPVLDLDAEERRAQQAISDTLNKLSGSTLVFGIPDNYRDNKGSGPGAHILEALSRSKKETAARRGPPTTSHR